MGQQLSLEATEVFDLTAPGRHELGADDKRHAVRERQTDRTRLVGLAGVARARQALAEATKRAEERHFHQAA